MHVSREILKKKLKLLNWQVMLLNIQPIIMVKCHLLKLLLEWLKTLLVQTT